MELVHGDDLRSGPDFFGHDAPHHAAHVAVERQDDRPIVGQIAEACDNALAQRPEQ